MRSLGPRDLGRALSGHEETLLAFAASPGTFRLGLLFVFSAGLAREYDGVYLLPEFWHALLPLAASLVTGTLFWLLFFWPWRGGAPSWKNFQGVFWLSAPLAWLYAIPYERFFAPLDAFYANLATLGFVSLWRVLWITRVLAVWRRLSFGRTLIGVLCLADLVVLVVGYVSPRPLIEFMGGVRGSELERAIGILNTNFFCLSLLALPVLFVVALFAGAIEPKERRADEEPRAVDSLSRSVHAVLASLVLLGLAAQGEQAKRWRVERDLVNGHIREALDFMGTRPPGDFPPFWSPPPHRYLRRVEPRIEAVLDELAARECIPWIDELFLPKIFHEVSIEGGYDKGELQSQLERIAQQQGEPTARRLLDRYRALNSGLEERERAAVEKLHVEVLAGAALLPQSEEGTYTLPGYGD